MILTGAPQVVAENHRVAPNRTQPNGKGPGHGVFAKIRLRVSAAREVVRATPGGRHVYRLSVGIIGAAVTLGGLLLVPLPGPGWLIVFVGLAILASEFRWAQHLLDFARERLHEWTQWLILQSLWVRAAVALATCGFVAGVLYLVALWRGVPDWLPDWVVAALPGL